MPNVIATIVITLLCHYYYYYHSHNVYTSRGKKHGCLWSNISTHITVAATIAIVRTLVGDEKKRKEILRREYTREYTLEETRRINMAGGISKVVDGNTVAMVWWWWWRWRTRSCNEGIVCRGERSLPLHTITGPLCDRTYGLLLWSVTRDIQGVPQSERVLSHSNQSQHLWLIIRLFSLTTRHQETLSYYFLHKIYLCKIIVICNFSYTL